MPKAYEAMRNEFSKTMPLKDAKSKAARIYNSKHHSAPVGPHSDEKAKSKKSKRPYTDKEKIGRAIVAKMY